jgi:ferritin-like metal-binding protein YciE
LGLFTKDIKTMEDLLLHGLQDIYYAEQQIIKSLPKMIEKATNRDLASGLKGHLEETNKQVERLQKAFEKLGKEPSGTSCPAIDGIIKEADETAGEIEDKTVLDAAIVANAQAVEHYEICRYGNEPKRGEGGEHQAQYGGAAQRRQRESFDCGLIWNDFAGRFREERGRPPLRDGGPRLNTGL